MRVIACCRPPRRSYLGSGPSRAKEMTGKFLCEFLALATVTDKAKKRKDFPSPPLPTPRPGRGRLIGHTGSGRHVG